MIFQEIVPTASAVLKEYDLCDSCTGRLFSKKLSLKSNKTLGKKIKSFLKIDSKKCFVCKGLLDNLKQYLEIMLAKSLDYQYATFIVGAILKPSIIDRDDFLRSKFKLKGIDSVKTDFTKEITRQFKRKTGKKLDQLDPELTFTINTKDNSCEIHSKYLIVQSQYCKLERGLPQKQKSCSNCSGKGCMVCSMHGINSFDSVEGVFSAYLFEKFGGTTARFTWVGGEDKNSLVLEPGRPFFVKLQNPNKRRVRLAKKIKKNPLIFNNSKIISELPKQPISFHSVVDIDIIKKNSLVFNNSKIISELPKQPMSFHSIIEIDIITKNQISSNRLKNLKSISSSPVVVYENSGKRSEKTIYTLKYKKTSKTTLKLKIDAEGGLPVKRFVNDSNVVPNIEQTIENPCKCNYFDFHKVFL